MDERKSFDSEVIESLPNIKVTSDNDGKFASYKFKVPVSRELSFADVIEMLTIGADIFVTVAGVKKQLKLEDA